MALIICPECGREISDSGKCCPNCGFLLKKSNHRSLLKIGAIINIISTVILALVFIALQIMASTDIATEESNTSGITMSYELNDQGASTSLNILVISTIIIFVLSICNLVIKKKIINIIISIILFILAITSGVTIFVSGFSMFICCIYWIFLFTPILNIIGSILCLIGSILQND